MPVRTHGLTHLALSVRDPARSVAFYREVFGVKPYWSDASSIQVLGPGRYDVLAFEKGKGAGERAGIDHFGFRLARPKDIDAAVEAIERAGGTIVDRGWFTKDQPYVFFEDLDGYLVEVWYEAAELKPRKPTPKRPRKTKRA